MKLLKSDMDKNIENKSEIHNILSSSNQAIEECDVGFANELAELFKDMPEYNNLNNMLLSEPIKSEQDQVEIKKLATTLKSCSPASTNSTLTRTSESNNINVYEQKPLNRAQNFASNQNQEFTFRMVANPYQHANQTPIINSQSNDHHLSGNYNSFISPNIAIKSASSSTFLYPTTTQNSNVYSPSMNFFPSVPLASATTNNTLFYIRQEQPIKCSQTNLTEDDQNKICILEVSFSKSLENMINTKKTDGNT